MAKLPVFAVIPNYNMGEQLKRLLPTLIHRGYAHIYVIDDLSADNSQQIASEYSKDNVTFVSAKTNVGAGATRNRILLFQTVGIAHFLDADTELLGDRHVDDDISGAFERHPDAGAIGFQVLTADKAQFGWNFGPIISNLDIFTSRSWYLYNSSRLKFLHPLLKRMFKNKWQNWWNYANMEAARTEHKVGVVVECNMAVNLEDFARVGGFDSDLRYHEIHSLALKLKSIDKTMWYVPEVTAIKHNDVDVRPNRKNEMQRGLIRLDFKRLTGHYKIK